MTGWDFLEKSEEDAKHFLGSQRARDQRTIDHFVESLFDGNGRKVPHGWIVKVADSMRRCYGSAHGETDPQGYFVRVAAQRFRDHLQASGKTIRKILDAIDGEERARRESCPEDLLECEALYAVVCRLRPNRRVRVLESGLAEVELPIEHVKSLPPTREQLIRICDIYDDIEDSDAPKDFKDWSLGILDETLAEAERFWCPASMEVCEGLYRLWQKGITGGSR